MGNLLVKTALRSLLHAQALDFAVEPTRNDGDVGAIVVCGQECALIKCAIIDGARGLVDGSCTSVAGIEGIGSACLDALGALDWK